MTDSGYINPAFRPQPGRKCFNHMATWTGGYWHRHWLLSSGQYIKTSEQRGMGFPQFLRGPLPEYTPDPVGAWGERLEQLRKTYPRRSLFPHHRGAALWVPSEPGSRHWPGCGCP